MFFGGGGADFEDMFGHGARGGGGRRGGGEPDTKLYEALGVPKTVRGVVTVSRFSTHCFT